MSSRAYMLTTVLQEPPTDDLTTAQTVMDDWQIEQKDKAFIQRTVTRCSAAAMDYCNRRFGVAQYQATIRLELAYRDGHLRMGAVNPILLPYWPIASITSIVEVDINGTQTTLVEGTDFEARYETGMLFRLDAQQRERDWWPRMKVIATYYAGYLLPGQNSSSFPGAKPLPAHVEDAIGRMVATRYFERSRDPFVRSETVEGIGRTDYIVSNTAQMDNGNLSPDVMDILNNFRQPVLA